MGSHSVDSGTQKQASAGAQGSDATLTANANKNQLFTDQTRQAQFGTYNPATGGFSGGSVSGFLNPSNLQNGGLSGSYLQNYNNSSNTLANDTKNAVGTTEQNLASRGMGKSPAGFAADEERKAYQDAAATRGNLYTGLATGQHNEALNDYWNANNLLNSNATGAANLSVQGNQAAAGNYASLYGTASQQTPSGWAVAGQTLAGLGSAASGFMPRPQPKPQGA